MKLQPQDQFEHSLPELIRLGKRYGLTLQEYSEATSGIENTTLIVRDVKSKYVFRIYRQAKKTIDQIRAEIDFMAYLQVNHVPVPTVLENLDGGVITEFDHVGQSWQLIVMEFIAGEHPKTISPKLLNNMATTQAKMHQLAAKYSDQSKAIPKLKRLVETEFIHQIDISSLSSELRGFLDRGAAYNVELDDKLPAGPCHLDYDEQNMLCQNNTIAAVLDFDDLAIAPFVVCLAYTIWHITDEQGESAAKSYLRTYEQTRPLSAQERHMLPAIILFRHYMICALKVLNGNTNKSNIEKYLTIEASLLSRT